VHYKTADNGYSSIQHTFETFFCFVLLS